MRDGSSNFCTFTRVEIIHEMKPWVPNKSWLPLCFINSKLSCFFTHENKSLSKLRYCMYYVNHILRTLHSRFPIISINWLNIYIALHGYKDAWQHWLTYSWGYHSCLGTFTIDSWNMMYMHPKTPLITRNDWEWTLPMKSFSYQLVDRQPSHYTDIMWCVWPRA